MKKVKELFAKLKNSGVAHIFWANRFYLLSLVILAFALKLLFLSSGLTVFVSVGCMMYMAFWVAPPKLEAFLSKRFKGRL